jgi:hypothetical protein
MTPSIEPALELMMVLTALESMKSSLSAKIHKVNECVDTLILNPPDLVPSLQPYADFGDFTLPTTSDHQQFNDVALNPKDHARYTTLDKEIHTEGLYFDLAKILHSTGHCAAFNEEAHLTFAEFLHHILRELGWPLTPATFLEEQLNHLARCWNARCSEEVAATKHFQDLDLFNDLFDTNHPCSAVDLAHFSTDIDWFCAHYKKTHPLCDSDYVFVKEFLTKPPTQPLTPSMVKTTYKVHFLEPPITTINTLVPPLNQAPLWPLSDIPVPNPNDFPALAGKPFRDMWTMVTKQSKRKKQAAPGPPTPAPPTNPGPGPTSFAQVTIGPNPSGPASNPKSKTPLI